MFEWLAVKAVLCFYSVFSFCFYCCCLFWILSLTHKFTMRSLTLKHWILSLWIVLCVQLARSCWSPLADLQTTNSDIMIYARADLLDLRQASSKILTLPLLDLIPKHLLRKIICRKRGSRGGIRNKVRRQGSRLPLPAIVLSNVWCFSVLIGTQICYVLLNCGCLRTLCWIWMVSLSKNREINWRRSLYGCKW